MPCGVQLVARRHADARLLGLAQELEGALAGALRADLAGEARWHVDAAATRGGAGSGDGGGSKL